VSAIKLEEAVNLCPIQYVLYNVGECTGQVHF